MPPVAGAGCLAADVASARQATLLAFPAVEQQPIPRDHAVAKIAVRGMMFFSPEHRLQSRWNLPHRVDVAESFGPIPRRVK